MKAENGKSRNGFSLIEMLVVMGIIAVIASLLIILLEYMAD